MSTERKYKLNEIKLELTYQCPLRCLHCSSDSIDNNQAVISFENAADIVQQAIRMGAKKISFSGGEPLLWDGLDSLVKKCSARYVYPTLYTSGISPDNLNKIKHLKACGLKSIVFSMYAASFDIHDSITCLDNSHQTTLCAIHYSQSIGLATELHFVPMKLNYRELPSLAILAQKLGLEKISILRFVPQGRGMTHKDLALSKEETRELQVLIDMASEYIHLRIGSPYSILFCSQSPKCMSGIDRLTILPDLSIAPCDAFKQVSSYRIVSTDTYSTLERWTLQECWNKSPYLNAIRSYIEAPLEKPCFDCERANTCFSGCTAQKYLAHGELRKVPDPLCLTIK